MKKTSYIIKTREGFERVEGYITDDGKHGIHNRDKAWYITDIPTGIALQGVGFAKRKEAEASIKELEQAVKSKKIRESAKYKDAVKELKDYMGNSKSEVKTESEDKTMATKTNTTKAKRTNYKAENEALKKEIEILKKQIEGLTRVEVEKTTLDTFDVEGYLSKRDDTNRITSELVEAITNTKGLSATREGKDEWLFVRGDSEEATKSRKDIFKAMSFKWSPNHNAWILAPYPIRSKKAWGARKARKAMAEV